MFTIEKSDCYVQFDLRTQYSQYYVLNFTKAFNAECEITPPPQSLSLGVERSGSLTDLNCRKTMPFLLAFNLPLIIGSECTLKDESFNSRSIFLNMSFKFFLEIIQGITAKI